MKFITLILVIALVLPCCFCQDEYPEPDLRRAVVVVLCNTIRESDILSYQISEIWRDHSNGEFKQAVGDKLYIGPRQVKKNTSYGEQMIVLYAVTYGEIYPMQTVAVYGNVAFAWHEKTLEELRTLVNKTPYADLPQQEENRKL